MRVTFVLPPLSLAGGIRVVSIYADRLRQRGHEVTVVSTPPRPYPWLDRIKDYLRGKGWPTVERANSAYFDPLPIDLRVLDRFRPVQEADLPDADVIVATWWETAEWILPLSPSKGAKAVFIQGYEIENQPDRDRLEATWRAPLQKIVIAQWLADLAREKFGDPRTLLVPNAVDLEQFNAPERSKQDRPSVGLVYSPHACKGCDIALAAYELARQQVKELQLVMFGASRPRHALPPGARFLYRPAQAKIREIYSSCDAWLFPSRSEGFGLPILEAMACRTPVIATPAGAAPELVGQGGGLLVRPDDPSDLANGIEKIAKLPDNQWKALSEAARRTAAGYTWDDATRLFEAALRQTIDRAARPAPAVNQWQAQA